MAAAAMVGAPAVAEPLADITGLPEGPVLDVVRAAVGEIDEPVVSVLDARRRADRARDRALAALRSEGYYAARVDAQVEPGEPPRARLEIAPGRRFVIGAVSVELVGPLTNDRPGTLKAAQEAVANAWRARNGDDDDDDGAIDGGSAGLLAAGMDGDGLRAGAPARAEDVIAAEARAVAAVIEAGHPDVRALDRQIVVDHARGEMDVVLRIDAGRQAVLGPVQTAGDARLREAYVARLAPFQTGDLYDQEALDTLGTRLRETGAFESVAVSLAEPEEPPGPEGRVLRPVIAEVNAGDRHTVSLGATYSTTEGGGVDGEWVRRNLWGGGEELTVSAALRTIDRRLGVEVAAPHWRRPGRTLRLNTSLSDETTDAFDRAAAEAGARIETRLSDRASGSVGVGASLSEVDDGTDVERFALVFASGAINWDGSNDPLDPTRGVRANALARPTAGTGDGPLAYLVLDGGASAYQPIQGDRLVAAARARMAGVVGPPLSELPANERFFAGGGGSVRGYEYQSLSPRDEDGDLVGGRSVMEVAAELRYRGEGRFGYVAFVDGGVASTELTPDLSDMRWGAGVGVRYYASVGPIRADIATPLDPNDGDAPVQLYLSIGQAF